MKNILKVLSTFVFISLYSIAIWAWSVQKFEVQTNPSKANVWEAVDLTIKALDKDWNTLKDYVGEVLIFSQSDTKAEFPWLLTDNTYKFKASDSWVVKFENAVKFTKAWTQDINVYDTSNENVYWLAEVEVTSWGTTTSSWEISIKSPENGITVWTDKIKVSWTTLKNHKVKIFLNTNKEFNAISNWEWFYEADVSPVPSWDNFLVAKVLDSDWKSVGESEKILFKVESSAPKFKSIKVNPEAEVVWESLMNLELESTPKLGSVEVVLNDVIQKLTETSKAWVYTWSITAPKDNWEYKLDVILKNELWVESKQNWVYTVVVKNIELAAAPVEEPEQTSTWINCDDLKKELVIKNIKLVKMKTKSVLSWDKIEKANSYNLYKKDKSWTGMILIQNLTENQVDINIGWDKIDYDDFAVKAVFKNENCDIESSDYSNMTKVQTWPREIILIIVSLLMVSWMFYLRRKSI